MERFECGGALLITVDKDLDMITIHYSHLQLHERPCDVRVPPQLEEFIQANIGQGASWIYQHICRSKEYPQITQKQVYAHWAKGMANRYKMDPDPKISSRKLVEQNNGRGYRIIFEQTTPTYALAFTTPFFREVKSFHTLLTDATYKTNGLGWELYAINTEVDGAGVVIGYILLEGEGPGGYSTATLTKIYSEFRKIGVVGVKNFMTLLKYRVRRRCGRKRGYNYVSGTSWRRLSVSLGPRKKPKREKVRGERKLVIVPFH
jgi:hypothetical protein